MKKTLVIYWSGTGNTEAMANAVLEGMKAAGADASLLTPDQVTAASLSGVSSVAMGCPAMGSEVLEEMEFQPMFDSIRNQLGGKSVGLFGSYGWGDGEWMRSWEKDCGHQPGVRKHHLLRGSRRRCAGRLPGHGPEAGRVTRPWTSGVCCGRSSFSGPP